MDQQQQETSPRPAIVMTVLTAVAITAVYAWFAWRADKRLSAMYEQWRAEAERNGAEAADRLAEDIGSETA